MALVTQLSFLHVTDFAQAVGQWLSAETIQTQTYELCDGVSGGYDWQRVQQLAADARCGSVRMGLAFLCRYSPALRISVPR